jgi:uncharacterized membrane protein
MRFLAKISARTWILVLLCLVAVVGFADTIYLVMKEAAGQSVVCSVTDGCGAVLESEWASVAGVPTAVYGLGYYAVTVVFTFAYAIWQDDVILQLLLVVVTVGFGVTLFLMYLQIFVINAFCAYCIASAAATTILFTMTSSLLYQNVMTKTDDE